MPSISLVQQPTKHWVTKESRNGGLNCQQVLAVLILHICKEIMILRQSPNFSDCHSSQGRMETKEWIMCEPMLFQSKLKLTDVIMTVNAV
jgi:hypothetical protein